MDNEFDQRYTDYQSERSALRKQVRRIYLRSAASQLHGPVLDFGCGVGELLEKLPAGSLGLEYNLATVAHCRGKGLEVEAYDGFAERMASRIGAVLTEETRDAILRLKYETPDTESVIGAEYYAAVLSGGVRDYAGLTAWREAHRGDSLIGWLP